MQSNSKSRVISPPGGEGPAANKQWCLSSLLMNSYDSLFDLPITYFAFSLCIDCLTFVVHMLLLLFLML